MTAPIPNSMPPPETTRVEVSGPKRAAGSGPLRTPPDGTELSNLSRTVTAALGSSDSKVDSLRQRVAAGTYVVDPVKVVEKILQNEKPE